jgi:hypothetical protein
MGFRPKQVHGDAAWTHCKDDCWVACKPIASRFCHESKLDGIIGSGWTPLADELDFKGGAHPREVASGAKNIASDYMHGDCSNCERVVEFSNECRSWKFCST